MNIIRKIKLEKLGYYQYINNEEKELFIFVKENLLNLKKVKLKDYSSKIFYFKDNNCIFIYDNKINNFNFKYKFWLIFINNFNYTNKETKEILKSIVIYHYKLTGIDSFGFLNEENLKLYEYEYYKENKIK